MGGPDADKLQEECGIFGTADTGHAAPYVALGLHALQHRGQEAGGIISHGPDAGFSTARAFGLVRDNFTSTESMASLPGGSAIGHVRYSTAGPKGKTAIRDVQPFFGELAIGGCAIAHNGTLTNAAPLRRDLIAQGAIFQSSSDSECFIHLMAQSRAATLEGRLIEAIGRVEGAFALIALTESTLFGARDPLGIRPLVIGQMAGGAHVLASETCALDIVGARVLREVEPGELVAIRSGVLTSTFPFARRDGRFCLFEHVYFARPDSVFGGQSVYQVRHNIGRELAHEAPVAADLVCPVPDSGTPAALGFAEATGIPFALGITRNQYQGRTFIEPTDHIRNMGVRLKLNVNRRLVAGKRIVLVDDSIVRGTTSRKIKEMILEAGAAEVHFRIASPPTAWPCFYGVDTPSRQDLLAAQMTIEEMRDWIGVNSLRFVSIDGLYRAAGQAAGRDGAPRRFCDACFTGEYPIGVPEGTCL